MLLRESCATLHIRTFLRCDRQAPILVHPGGLAPRKQARHNQIIINMLVDALAFTGSCGIVLVVFNDFQSCSKADAHRQESGSVTMLAAEKQVSHAGGDDYAAQDF